MLTSGSGISFRDRRAKALKASLIQRGCCLSQDVGYKGSTSRPSSYVLFTARRFAQSTLAENVCGNTCLIRCILLFLRKILQGPLKIAGGLGNDRQESMVQNQRMQQRTDSWCPVGGSRTVSAFLCSLTSSPLLRRNQCHPPRPTAFLTRPFKPTSACFVR